ncbi:substrate-binding domain-containing protein [Microbacteriaceae bacterium VKM Ac-2855]|nr:substrate-binding domain-containing protein [Microbacteriaceae bacterium VKM Ac-2855]
MARTPATGPTLDAVAARAGVSKATASKVLNGRPGTADATRIRVEEAIRSLGYVPSTRSAPTRTATRTPSVSVVFDTLVSVYSLRVLEGMVAAAQRGGVDLVIRVLTPGVDPDDHLRLDEALVADAASSGHLGIVAVTTAIAPEVVAACAAAGLALVAVDPPDPLEATVASIGSNHWAGGFQATEHLIGLGHRRIAFVGGDPRNAGLRARFGGYREALLGAGIPDDPALVSQEGMMSAEAAIADLLALTDPPTAVFATNDGDAFAAIRGLQLAGMRVPIDVSVIGYDDTYSSIPTAPQLTTVHTPMHAIGRAAIDTIRSLHAGSRAMSHHLELATTVVVRESTAPPRR